MLTPMTPGLAPRLALACCALGVVACSSPQDPPSPRTAVTPPAETVAASLDPTPSATASPTVATLPDPTPSATASPTVATPPDPTPSETASPAPSETSLDLQIAFPNLRFQRMVALTHAGDGTNRLFLVLQPGQILTFQGDEDTQDAALFLDIRDRVNDTGNEEGLLGLAFDPEYAVTGELYVSYTASNPRRSVISRFTVHADDPGRADPASEEVILEVAQPFSNHNGGNILFGPDGKLYIGLGDGGSGGDPRGHGQNPATLLGALLRIDPRAPEGEAAYRVPRDNPFLDASDFRDEIWAYGFRNPWRFSFDHVTGDLWVGDVGQNRYEEIDLVLRGRNYGWSRMEGRHCYPASASSCDDAGLAPPVVEYALSDGNCSVIGGYVYRGTRIPSLVGTYVYGDFCSGRVWGLDHDGTRATDHRLIVDTPLQISSFGEGPDRELYLLSFDGRIYRFTDGR